MLDSVGGSSRGADHSRLHQLELTATGDRVGQRAIAQIATERASVSVGPGAYARDPLHGDVGDVAGRRVVHGREADVRAEVGTGEFLEELGGASLGDAGGAVDDEVLV